MSDLFRMARAILDAYNKIPSSGVVVFGTIRTGSEILDNPDVKHLLTPEMASRASVYTTPVYLPLSAVIGDTAVQLMEHLSQMEEESLEQEFFLIRSTKNHTVVPHTYETTVVHNGESFHVYFRVHIDGWDAPLSSAENHRVIDIHPLISAHSFQLKPYMRIKLEQAIRVVFGSKE